MVPTPCQTVKLGQPSPTLHTYHCYLLTLHAFHYHELPYRAHITLPYLTELELQFPTSYTYYYYPLPYMPSITIHYLTELVLSCPTLYT